MKTRRGTVLMVVIGVVLCVVIVGVGAAAWFFFSAFESTASDDATATRTFDDVRNRFGEQPAIIEIRGKDAVLTRRPPDAAPSRDLQRVQIIAWDPDEETLSRITLPWWLLRLKETPIDLSAEIGGGFTGAKVSLSSDDIERYGPSLLVEFTDQDGSRVLVWTE